MSDESFLYIAPAEKFGAANTFTFEMLANIKPGTVVPGRLYNRDLWVAVEREGQVHLFARLFVVSVEEILDQGVKNLYLVAGDIARSAYFQRIDSRLPQLRIENIYNEAGVFPLVDSDRNRLVQISNSATRITNLRPPAIAVEGFSLKSMAIRKLNIRNIIENLKRKHPISEIPKHVSDPMEWSPYESFAFGCVLSFGELDKETVRYELARIVKNRTEPYARRYRSIETTFSPINPDTIMVRRYVGPTPGETFENGAGAILKTEAAEKTHQEMLRDICKYLTSCGVVPQDNRNVDLFIELEGGNTVFEIKSANVFNFYTQAMKGAMQLQEYCFSLNRMSIPVKRRCLIIENIENEHIMNYCHEFLNYIGIQFLVYKKNIEWPNRLMGLKDLLS